MDMLKLFFFFSSRRRHTRFDCDWSSDVCSSDLEWVSAYGAAINASDGYRAASAEWTQDRKSTRLNYSHSQISYAVFCLKKEKKNKAHRLPNARPRAHARVCHLPRPASARQTTDD